MCRDISVPMKFKQLEVVAEGNSQVIVIWNKPA